MNVLMSSAVVVSTCVVLAYAIKVRNDLRSKGMYVTLFQKLAVNFFDEPEFNPILKKFLYDISEYIQDKRAADFVGRPIEDNYSYDSEIVRLLDGAKENPTKEQIQFLHATFYYLMALSYSSPRYGGPFRRRLGGELSDQDALARESARVSHSLDDLVPA